MKTCIHFLLYLAQFFLEWEMYRKKVVDKIKKDILCSITFSFRKFITQCEKIRKGQRGHRWQCGGCASHAWHLRLQTQTFGIFSTVCFYTATMVARTRLNFTLEVIHFLSCYFLRARSQKAIIRFVMPVCPTAWNNSAPTVQIFMKICIWVFFENLPRNFKFH
jgi:hypothetical protein